MGTASKSVRFVPRCSWRLLLPFCAASRRRGGIALTASPGFRLSKISTRADMLLFSLLQQLEPTFKPKETKIHLARFNGSERPIDVFIAERFDQWQSWQSRKNFSRQFVLSLIDAGAGRWLYVGLFRSIGCDDNSHAFVPQGNWSKRTGPTRCSRARSVLLKQRLPLSSRGRMIDGWLAGGRLSVQGGVAGKDEQARRSN